MYDLFARTWETPDQLGPQLAKWFTLAHANPTQRPDASPAGLNESAEDTAATIVHGLKITRLGANIPARTIARAVELSPGRLIGFAGIDVSITTWPDDLKAALDLGLKGVTVSPSAQGTSLSDGRFTKLFEACETHKLPVMIENRFVRLGETELELANPIDLDHAAKRFTSVKFVISEAGFPWTEQAMLVALRRDNVFLELSSCTGSSLLIDRVLALAVSLGVDSRLLLSSCYPFATARQAAHALLFAGWPPMDTRESPVPRAAREAIVSRDTLAALGLSKPASPNEMSSPRKIVEKTIV